MALEEWAMDEEVQQDVCVHVLPVGIQNIVLQSFLHPVLMPFQ